jgi:hypothetical protein
VHQRLGRTPRQPVQPLREQFLAHTRLPQQQHRQLGIGHHLQLVQQVRDGFTLAQYLAVFALLRRTRRQGAGGQSQAANLRFKTGHPHRSLDRAGKLGHVTLGLRAEGPDLQRIQRDHSPALALHVQRHAHAVVHRHRLSRTFGDQTIVGIGQHAIVVETGDAAPLQDGRQARMVLDREAPSQCVTGKPVHRHRP